MKRTLLLIICCVMVSGVMLAGEVKKVAPVESSIQKVDDVKQESPTVSSGIEVHGHWRIEILDKDGKSVSVTEFDNEFFGNNVVSKLLSGSENEYGSSGGFRIQLMGTPDPCVSSDCYIAQNSFNCGDGLTHHSTNLNISAGVSIQLSGSVIAEQNSAIEGVQVTLKHCYETILPSACENEDTLCSFRNFSGTALPTPQNVQSGQQILVTIEISFS